MTRERAQEQPSVTRAECVLPAGDDLDASVRFFIDELGFRLESIGPADAPAYARLSGHGLALRLETSAQHDPGVLRITAQGTPMPKARTAPNGTRIAFVRDGSGPAVPAPSPRASIRLFDPAQPGWTRGRAGMLYRDLIPDRAGGYLIASHIRIPEGGPVPDDVHHHAVRFQFIYCHRGWVRLVYEDQGEPFVMEAGDCVLQPPHIRHRVLEASDGLEVIELACPAEHETSLDHEMPLPTGRHRPEREYGGQAFALHRARGAAWTPRPGSAFEARDIGLRPATRGRVDVHVLRPRADAPDDARYDVAREGSFTFLFVLAGALAVALDERPAARLGADGTCVIPASSTVRVGDCSRDLELLEVTLPGT